MLSSYVAMKIIYGALNFDSHTLNELSKTKLFFIQWCNRLKFSSKKFQIFMNFQGEPIDFQFDYDRALKRCSENGKFLRITLSVVVKFVTNLQNLIFRVFFRSRKLQDNSKIRLGTGLVRSLREYHFCDGSDFANLEKGHNLGRELRAQRLGCSFPELQQLFQCIRQKLRVTGFSLMSVIITQVRISNDDQFTKLDLMLDNEIGT